MESYKLIYILNSFFFYNDMKKSLFLFPHPKKTLKK